MALFRKTRVGFKNKRYPIPMRDRNPFMPRILGGSQGWRGSGWDTARKKALLLYGERSQVGSTLPSDGLMVDHIHPFRLGGSNDRENLRISDTHNNPYIDFAVGMERSKPKRRRGF